MSFFTKPIAFLPSAVALYREKPASPPPPGSVSVVVRHVNERTLDWCVGALREALPQAPLHLVSATPFAACLRQAYAVSLESGTPWSLHVDADVLCLAEPLYQLLDHAKKQRRNIFAFSVLFMDKFFMFPRAAGLHLYRTKYLSRALDCFAPDGVTSRPETFVKRAMAKLGYPTIQTDFLFGLHDYEQCHKHIVKKGALFRKKFSRLDELLPYWREKLQDQDFAVALLGASQDIPFPILLDDNKSKSEFEKVPLPEEKTPLHRYESYQEMIQERFLFEFSQANSALMSKFFPAISSWSYMLGPAYPRFIEYSLFLWNQFKTHIWSNHISK